MAAVAHESLAEDEILRRADELKKAVNEANTRDKIPAFDRSALDTQEWRPVVLECIELLTWRLLDEHGEVLDEGPDCPGAGFSEDSLLADVGSTYYVLRQQSPVDVQRSRGGARQQGEESDGGNDEQHEQVEQHEEKDYDRVRVRHLASKRVGTLRTRSGCSDQAMPANKLVLIFDDGRRDHLYIKPDDLSSATKVLTEEEDTTLPTQRAVKLLRAPRGTAVDGVHPVDFPCPVPEYKI